MRKVLLIAITVIAIAYCFRFGYILTAYSHGGQLIGIPFAAVIFFLSLVYFVDTREMVRRRLFNLAFIIFMVLAGFSLTIEFIRKAKENYFEFLYHDGGWVNKFLLGWIAIGIVIFFVNERMYKKSIQQ
ncbi:hypothetical protein POV27_05635 [Aureisphaera galaxeae]|uniref:hypothetical protein n=1 Tax=Aureisphaera galaxeae TaxID=1538023 RepID=UPI002350E75D|nr:hypothetical protein [Aureisphaera galaxeae]MDC8003522.1 hypothetical protein [Aureisphaera galaxeae]